MGVGCFTFEINFELFNKYLILYLQDLRVHVILKLKIV